MSWLIDRSALIRIKQSPDGRLWFERIQAGEVRIGTAAVLEMGFAARGASDWAVAVRGLPVNLMPRAHTTPAVEDRAVEVQGLLAARGQHRAPSLADLLIAATAELSGLTVLHVDDDYDLIAAVTGQPVERLWTD